MTIILNAARCKLCDEVIYSKYQHDFKFCKCGAVAVDGGTAYIKRAIMPDGDYTELSISPDYMYALANTIFFWVYESDEQTIWSGREDTVAEVGADYVVDLIYLWLIKNKLYVYEPEIFLDPDIDFLSWGWYNPAGSPGNPLATYGDQGYTQ